MIFIEKYFFLTYNVMKTIVKTTIIYVCSPLCLWLWFPPTMIVFYMGVDDSTCAKEDARH